MSPHDKGKKIHDNNKVQAVALAVCTYYFGVWLKSKISILQKLLIPSPVVEGMTFVVIMSVLEYNGILKLQIDSSMQTVLMHAFFTTIGLTASLKLVTSGGKMLIGFLLAVTALLYLQNGVTMTIAVEMGLDQHCGLLAGSVSMMESLGTAAAFGPYFESTYGITGGTAVAITAATFGMVAALIIGGPFGEWAMRRYGVKTPKKVGEPELHMPDDMEAGYVTPSKPQPTITKELMKACSIVTICIGSAPCSAAASANTSRSRPT